MKNLDNYYIEIIRSMLNVKQMEENEIVENAIKRCKSNEDLNCIIGEMNKMLAGEEERKVWDNIQKINNDSPQILRKYIK